MRGGRKHSEERNARGTGKQRHVAPRVLLLKRKHQ
jgi:hypothetical protein